MPSRMRIVDDELILENACKTCEDRRSESDLMVIQCNASNVHGYQFIDAYINVLRKSLMLNSCLDLSCLLSAQCISSIGQIIKSVCVSVSQ